MNTTNSVTLQQWLRDYCSKSMVIVGCVALKIQGDQLRVLAEWPERDPVNLPLIDAGTIALRHGVEGVVRPTCRPDRQGGTAHRSTSARQLGYLGHARARPQLGQRQRRSRLPARPAGPETSAERDAGIDRGSRHRTPPVPCSACRLPCLAEPVWRKQPLPSSTNSPAPSALTGPAWAFWKMAASALQPFRTMPPSRKNRSCCAAWWRRWRNAPTKPAP